MRDVREIYTGSLEPPKYSYVYSYQPIINAIGNPVVQIDQNDYQGDTWVLLQKDDMYGYLCFGWGSCGGCDALQACENWEDLQKLANSMESSVIWFTNIWGANEWFSLHDWEGDYGWSLPEFREFIEKSRSYLYGKLSL